MEEKNVPAVAESGRYSPTQTAAIRNAQIAAVIDSQQKMLKRRTKGVNLFELAEVEAAANEYMDACREVSICPSFLGLVAHMGLGRSWSYQFIRQHPTHETSLYLCRLREAWAAGKLGLAQKGVLSDASVIFELKNASLGFSDTHQLEVVTAGAQDETLNRPAWAIGLSAEEYTKKLIEALPDDE